MGSFGGETRTGMVVRYAVSIILCIMAGVTGSAVTVTGTGSWYASLEKPWFTPPDWVFGPVWTTLYILMGISLAMVWGAWKENNPLAKTGIILFAIQLGLNVAWSFVFFGLQSPPLGLAGIVALWIAILATIVWFWRIRRIAAVLLIPYIVWVTIAAFLNYSLLVLNP
ncbi:tryptophan-rich sensory protein [Methanolinea mesophila]|uniref:TspO/MBR family protein n=1 Tax=Methanolinea mesophila TaxID=547055 RepID=UPI001FD738C7|nr:TspO/MBR family protein [Methanolinea mesophila]MBP1927545.1 tryptophan-rich sensory protein [Methanolinea mesophila]